MVVVIGEVVVPRSSSRLAASCQGVRALAASPTELLALVLFALLWVGLLVLLLHLILVLQLLLQLLRLLVAAVE